MTFPLTHILVHRLPQCLVANGLLGNYFIFLTEDIEIVILTISDHVGVHKAPGGSLRL